MGYWKSYKDKWPCVRQFSFKDWLVILEAWLVQEYFNLALRLVSFEKLLARSHPPSQAVILPGEVLPAAHRVQRLANAAACLHLSPATCLRRSLALRWMLIRRGIRAQLRLGVLKSAGDLQAHAWVEIDGQPLGEAETIKENFQILSK
jgi:hypothetical protein